MGASNRGITLGSPHNSVRLHTSVWPKPSRFDGVHLTVVSSASKASVLHQELSSLLLKGAIEEVPQSDLKQDFFSRYFLVPKKDPFWTCVIWTSPFTKGSSRCWRWRLLCPRLKWETGLSLSTWRMPIFTFRSSGSTETSFGLPLEDRLTNTRFFPLTWPWPRGRSQSAWMLLWPLWGSRAFVYSTT